MSKKALITGISGQDGSYLAELLLGKGYKVFGITRRRSQGMPQNLAHLLDKITIIYSDMIDRASLATTVREVQPDEIYNLAAQSVPRESWRCPAYTLDVTTTGFVHLLEAARAYAPSARFYQASTSEIFGDAQHGHIDETAPYLANNPYGVAKLAAHLLARVYRLSYGMFVSCGILFNHESPRRSPDFVSRKVSLGAAATKLGVPGKARNEEGESILTPEGKLLMGNLQAQRDWGHAQDYVRAMWLMLQQPTPDDYIVATGKLHSVEDLLAVAYGYVGLDWREYVVIDSRFLRPTEIAAVCSDSEKARRVLGWEPTGTFEQLVQEMVENDINHLQR